MRVAVLIAIVLAYAPAFAQHDHAVDAQPDATQLSAGVSFVVATFDTMLYVGNYEGIVPAVRWSSERLTVMATGAAYRIEKNGGLAYGLGDVALHGQVMLLQRPKPHRYNIRMIQLDPPPPPPSSIFEGGVALGVSATPSQTYAQRGLGMGHVMVMPAVYGAWSSARMRAAASVGYSRAVGGERHEGHGAWPLVSPMFTSELSWNAGAEILLARRVSAGLRGAGGIALGEGDVRAMLGSRVAWQTRQVDMSFELQAGVAGDPFVVRGVVSTALTFR